VGTIAGGQNDPIILTNLGTPGWISPVGIILSISGKEFTIEDVDSINAESRSHSYIGKAWKAGFKLSVIDATTHQMIQTVTIVSVIGDKITVDEDLLALLPTVKNGAGFIVSGHFLKYASYDKVIDDQNRFCAYFTYPQEGYPTTTTKEIEELRSGKMNFDDQRLPYVLHPAGYIPTVV
jgi:hypothetical protein